MISFLYSPLQIAEGVKDTLIFLEAGISERQITFHMSIMLLITIICYIFITLRYSEIQMKVLLLTPRDFKVERYYAIRIILRYSKVVFAIYVSF